MAYTGKTYRLYRANIMGYIYQNQWVYYGIYRANTMAYIMGYTGLKL